MTRTRTCSSCGQVNRVPPRHLAHSGRCGACKASLPPLDRPVDVDVEEFDAIVQASDVPVLVDFWAEWCGPCRMAAPHVERVARELAGRAVVLKVNTEHQPDLSRRFDVTALPTFAVFRGGQMVLNEAGLVDHGQMRRWLLAA